MIEPATVIMDVLARGIFDPLYCDRVQTDERLFFVVEHSRVHERAVIALKFLRSCVLMKAKVATMKSG
jgi:hypothetical protein